MEGLPQDHAAIEMDFSDNFASVLQEIQSMHWTHVQVTIHSMVIWRPAISSDEVAESHEKKHRFILSENRKHDYSFE